MLKSTASYKRVGYPKSRLPHHADQLVAIVSEGKTLLRMDLQLVVERADLGLVVRMHADDELLRGLLHEVEGEGHAAARVQHDHRSDRLRLVVEVGERLQLAVVVDLEVLLHETGDQATVLVGHRHVHGDCLRRDLDLRVRGHDQGAGGDRQ